MNRELIWLIAAVLLAASPVFASEVLVETESFSKYGGWVHDSQFIENMGSPYLLAHGLGKPVADAKTEVAFPDDGTYFVWARTKDWVPSHHPGRFKIVVGGSELATEFGANSQDWNWQMGGTVDVKAGSVSIALKDLTGFDGRCDAVFFTTDAEMQPPNKSGDRMTAWRRKLLGQAMTPAPAGEFDLVVVGGGVAGCCTAMTASQLGLHVALIQERPVLGGNSSKELRIRAAGPKRPFVKRVKKELRKDKPFEAEKNLKLFLNMHAYGVEKKGSRITAVNAQHMVTGQRLRFTAPLFVDCTGDGWIGYWAGAEYRQGREGYEEFGESRAPNKPDRRTHGNSLFFRTEKSTKTESFFEVPWATEIAKDNAKLKGNGRGSYHRWEYGQGLDTLKEAERIRDHLLRAIYGSFSNAKTMYPEKNANLKLEIVSHIMARGESRRIIGDYIINEHDQERPRLFHDAVATSRRGFFCLHYIQEKYDFLGGADRPEWETAGRKLTGIDPTLGWLKEEIPTGRVEATVPFRSLYSRNIENLMMAGRCVSATHVAAMNIKLQNIGGQMGVATGTAAALCKQHGISPRDIYQERLAELQEAINRLMDAKQ
ncbi:MAG: FAD-dependent oxidoreductase [Planctomycetes bacterium]|nr:FAD-dependent oxidoreductase [Planctomycetota bacterium]